MSYAYATVISIGVANECGEEARDNWCRIIILFINKHLRMVKYVNYSMFIIVNYYIIVWIC